MDWSDCSAVSCAIRTVRVTVAKTVGDDSPAHRRLVGKPPGLRNAIQALVQLPQHIAVIRIGRDVLQGGIVGI